MQREKIIKKLIIIFIILILFLFILFILFFKKPVEIIKEKEILEIHEKEKKIIEKSIKEKIIVSKKKAEEIDYDIYILKINPHGELLWQKNIDNNFIDWAEFAFQTSENDIFFICRSYDVDELQDRFYIIKTDFEGNLLWRKNIEEIFINNQIKYTTKFGYITIGKIWSDDRKSFNLYLTATDNNGNYLWIKNFGREYYEWGNFILISEDGSYIIDEDINYSGLNYDFYFKKKDLTGKNLWAKSYGNDKLNKYYDIISAVDYGYVLIGSSYSLDDIKSVSYLLKVDNNGNKLWEHTFNESTYSEMFSIAKDNNNDGYLLAGTTNSKGSDLYDVYLIRTDLNGNKIWEKTFGGTGNDAAYYILNCNDGDFIITGVTQN